MSEMGRSHFIDKFIKIKEKRGMKGSKFLRKKSSVLMLSGGIDSVCLLKRLLLETDELLYVHHIHIKNNEGIQYPRYKKEAGAVRKIVPYMKKTFRNFNYTESTIDTRQINQLKPDYYEEEDFSLADLQFVPDQIYYYFIGGLLAKISISDKIYIGTCIEDYDIPAHWNQEKQDLYGVRNIQLWTERIVKLFASATSYPNKIKNLHRPHDDNSKKQSIEYLGEELMNMVWYCREPMEKNGEYVVCHECKSCKDVDTALSEKIN